MSLNVVLYCCHHELTWIPGCGERLHSLLSVSSFKEYPSANAYLKPSYSTKRVPKVLHRHLLETYNGA